MAPNTEDFTSLSGVPLQLLHLASRHLSDGSRTTWQSNSPSIAPSLVPLADLLERKRNTYEPSEHRKEEGKRDALFVNFIAGKVASSASCKEPLYIAKSLDPPYVSDGVLSARERRGRSNLFQELSPGCSLPVFGLEWIKPSFCSKTCKELFSVFHIMPIALRFSGILSCHGKKYYVNSGSVCSISAGGTLEFKFGEGAPESRQQRASKVTQQPSSLEERRERERRERESLVLSGKRIHKQTRTFFLRTFSAVTELQFWGLRGSKPNSVARSQKYFRRFSGFVQCPFFLILNLVRLTGQARKAREASQ